jgi:uncharacterized protein DUF2800
MSTERAHHPFSPSTLQARESCPHYTPAQGNSAASLAGTRQHDAVENEQDSEMLADHEALAVAECLGYADNIAKNYPGATILKEEYFPIDDEILEFDDGVIVDATVGTTAGYPDYVILSADKKTAEILDWKFGKQPVEDAENNLQGIAYMLGVKFRFPEVERCTVHFVMPHQDSVDRHTFELTPELRDNLYLRVRTIVQRAKFAQSLNDFSLARPSTSACMFCALVGKCSKVTELVLNIGKKFSPMQIPETISPNMVSDPADTSVGLKVAQVVTAWAKGYRAMVIERATTDPDFMPAGYKLIPMQRRDVVDALAIVELAKKLLPADKQAEVDKLLDVPITKVEELIQLVTPRGKKTKAVEAFGEELAKSGAVKLGKPYTILRQSGAETE